MKSFLRIALSYWADYNFLLKQQIGHYPEIFYPIYARKYPFNKMTVNSSTEVCIDGYPRCANSYAVYAFKLSNKVIIGHHHHVPAQIFRSVAMRIPTIVPIRLPEESVSSFLIFQNSTNADLYIKTYINFYKSIRHLFDRVVIADFDVIINDFNKVINSVNTKYNTNFNLIENLKEKQNEIFERLKEINNLFFGSNKRKLMYPDKSRERFKQEAKFLVKSSRFLEEANDIYEEILNSSSLY